RERRLPHRARARHVEGHGVLHRHGPGARLRRCSAAIEVVAIAMPHLRIARIASMLRVGDAARATLLRIGYVRQHRCCRTRAVTRVDRGDVYASDRTAYSWKG